MNQDKRLQDKLHSYIVNLARRRFQRYRTESGMCFFTEDDLVQEGRIGLWQAKEQFEDSKSESFEAFARMKIEQRLFEYCLANDRAVAAPIVIKRAASYIARIRAILVRSHLNKAEIEAVINESCHPLEASLSESAQGQTSEVKLKLHSAARHSGSSYVRVVEKGRQLSSLRAASVGLLNEKNLPQQFVITKTPLSRLMTEEKLERACKSMTDWERLVVALRAAGHVWSDVVRKLDAAGYTKNGAPISRRCAQHMLKKIRVQQDSAPMRCTAGAIPFLSSQKYGRSQEQEDE